MAEGPVKSDDEKSNPDKNEGKIFKCRFCQQSKPLDQMVLITRFFPPMIACRECEKELR